MATDNIARGMVSTVGKTVNSINQKIESLSGGVNYIGAVDYYADLPLDPQLKDAYTVKYTGESGNIEDGTEYVWAFDSTLNENTWIIFNKSTYSKEEVGEKVTQISGESTDDEYPSAKATYDYIQELVGEINNSLEDVLNGN